MAQKGEQMGAGAHGRFEHHPVNLVLLANRDRYDVYFNTFFPRGKALYLSIHSKYCHVPLLFSFDTQLYV
jgi:hypothetical protein